MYLIETRGTVRRLLDEEEVAALSFTRCTFKPTTFKYFVCTENMKIIGTDLIANPGDFIVIMNDRVLGYTPEAFYKTFDICPQTIKTEETYHGDIPQTC